MCEPEGSTVVARASSDASVSTRDSSRSLGHDDACSESAAASAAAGTDPSSSAPRHRRTSLDTSVSLCAAARRGDASACRDLVATGADVNGACARGGDTPLVAACRAGHAAAAQALLGDGADADLPCGRGATRTTPLHAAAGAGHADVVVVLVEAGANVFARARGESVLARASYEGHHEVKEILLDAGAVNERL